MTFYKNHPYKHKNFSQKTIKIMLKFQKTLDFLLRLCYT